jgi:hypothetical protein
LEAITLLKMVEKEVLGRVEEIKVLQILIVTFLNVRLEAGEELQVMVV